MQRSGRPYAVGHSALECGEVEAEVSRAMTLVRQIPQMLLVSVVLALGLSAASADGTASAPRCPRQAVAEPAPIEEVVRAARRLLPRAYHITNQQGRVRLTPENTQILEVVFLSPYQPRLRGSAALRRLARARCGRRIADRSWAIGVYFTELTVADNLSFAYLTKTPRGWSIWR